MTKKGFSLEKHRETGKELRKIRATLVSLGNEILAKWWPAWPMKEVYKKLKITVDSLLRVSESLEKRLVKEGHEKCYFTGKESGLESQKPSDPGGHKTQNGELSLERHKAMGRDLKMIIEALTRLYVEVGNAYPISGEKGKSLRELRKAEESLSFVRSKLEDRLCRDYPDSDCVKVYYGD